MRPSIEIAGVLALGATLLLSGPGVTVVRAEESLVSEAPPGPACSAAPEGAGVDLEALSRQLEKLRAEAPADSPSLVLNTRGYGYNPGDALERVRQDLLRVERDARNQAAE
jgi:hypothetical protein